MAYFRSPQPLALLALLAASSGCTVCHYARLTAVEEPKLFDHKQDDAASMAAYRALADQAWAESGACCPESCLAGDYAWGFREGFADYVYAGGSGEPPAVPPRPYWQLDLRSAEGAAAVESWFSGYRHGARVAREGGYRRTATIRLSASLLDCDACGCPEDRRSGDSDCSKCQVGAPLQSGPLLSPVQPNQPTPLPTPGELIPPEAAPEKVVEPLPTKPVPATKKDSGFALLVQPATIEAETVEPPSFEVAEALEAALEAKSHDSPTDRALFQIVR